MAEKKTPSVEPRLRFDAVAITLFVFGGLLATAFASARTVTGGPNWLGGWGDRASGLLIEPLGWAAGAFLLGWFVVGGLLVATRSSLHLA